jgi:DNA repair protein RecO (recombination protein O)
VDTLLFCLSKSSSLNLFVSIEKTEAIVLKAVNYRDTSKIVTFYTRRYGKMSAIAKGARNPKSKFGSLFQPLNYLQIVFYRRENRQLQYVSSSDFIRYFKSLTSSVERFSIAMSLIELVNYVMHDEEENENLFGLLVDSLTQLDREEVSPKNIFVHFGLHLAIDLGFAPNFEDCLICKKNIIDSTVNHAIAKVNYILNKGGPLCKDCSSEVNLDYVLSAAAIPALQKFLRLNSEEAGQKRVEPALQNELSNFVFVYLKKHSENLKQIKSLAILRSVQSETSTQEQL